MFSNYNVMVGGGPGRCIRHVASEGYKLTAARRSAPLTLKYDRLQVELDVAVPDSEATAPPANEYEVVSVTVLETVALLGPSADCVTVHDADAPFWPPAMRSSSCWDSSIIISISTLLSREMRSNLGKVLQFRYPA
jgi:hypothetical protein